MVVKDNALINASYNLDVNEQRLILLAIVVAREQRQEITPSDRINIDAGKFADQFGLTRWAAYKALKIAADNLKERRFSYIEITDKGNPLKLKKLLQDTNIVDSKYHQEMLLNIKNCG